MPVNRTVLLALVVLLVLGGLFVALRPDAPSSRAPDSGDSGAEGAQRKVFEVSVEDGGMDPEEIDVTEGDRVTLRLTSDAPLEVHLHGYDLEAEVTPDEPADLSFEANLTGRFEIEDHETEEALGVLLVQPR
jgi:FtsP/CotA-like multicopper oxidase with cupredoxin domain